MAQAGPASLLVLAGRSESRSGRTTPAGTQDAAVSQPRSAPATKRKAKPKRTPKDYYISASYNQAIEYGITRANEHIDDEEKQIPHWHANQLRHNAATVLRKEYGIELARIVLGHSTAFTTEIYAETDRDQAFAAVAKSVR